MVLTLNRLFLALALFVSSLVQAEILFDGYAKILAGDKHIGYFIQRYEFDPKKKEFKSTYFIQTSPEGGNIFESTIAVADDKFQPISVKYTSKVGGKMKTVDAKTKGQKFEVVTTENGQPPTKAIIPLTKDLFLSTFLQYLMLQKGYKVGQNFTYSAISEETGRVEKGKAFIKEEMKRNGVDGFKIINEYANGSFESFATHRGEVLATTSPVQGISTEIVRNPAEATQGLTVPETTLKLLFGEVPAGKTNVYYKNNEPLPSTPVPQKAEPTSENKPTPAKKVKKK
ncbi:MAG: hypothetical protein KDD22_03225 [Bdellovibrionales bacterium]|nr:hypothetical protein [Bdellovibrionales bacterium]